MRARLRETEIYFDIDGMGLVPEGDRMVERPVMFVLHGGPGADHSYLKPRMGPLTDTAQLVYLDHRGAGRSARGEAAEWTLANHAADVEALRQYLGLGQVVLFGTSYGGFVSQQFALDFPDSLAGLILCSTAPSYRILADTRQLVEERGTPGQQAICRRLWEDGLKTEEALYEYFVAMGRVYSQDFDETAFGVGWRRTIWNVEQLDNWFGGERRTFDFTDRLGEISCPTLVMSGAHDWICTPAQGRIMAERIPRAHLKVFANSGHSVGLDEPELFLAAVRGFLVAGVVQAGTRHGADS